MTRREWLACAGALVAGACARSAAEPQTPGGRPARPIHTVTGPIAPAQLGLTLMHEHVLVDFVGADKVSSSRYSADHAFTTVLPHLQAVRRLGCDTLVECTPAYLGRDPALLRRLSEASGVQILTNCGYYGAAKDKHLPAHAFTETAGQLAKRWVDEAQRGLNGTGIRPAFMKIGVDNGPLSAVDRKLVEAAALAHRETGLPIASHTPTGRAAIEQLDLLDAAGVPPSAFIWVHAHGERDGTFHTRVAQRGGWVEFDGIAPSTVDRHVELVRGMKERGVLGRVLVSHDAGWYRVGEPGGGEFRPYNTLFTEFLPRVQSVGLDEQDVRQLLVANPHQALAGR